MLRDRIWGIFFACMSIGYLGFWLAGRAQLMGLFLGLAAGIAAFYYLRSSDPRRQESDPRRQESDPRRQEIPAATPEATFERVEPVMPVKETD